MDRKAQKLGSWWFVYQIPLENEKLLLILDLFVFWKKNAHLLQPQVNKHSSLLFSESEETEAFFCFFCCCSDESLGKNMSKEES